MPELVRDSHGTYHVIESEKEEYYRGRCLHKIPEGDFYNGEYKPAEGESKEDLEVKEVEELSQENICEACEKRIEDGFEHKNEVPPADYPLLDRKEDIEVNRLGKPSRFDRRFLNIVVNKIEDFMKSKKIPRDRYDLMVDADKGFNLMLKIKGEDVLIDINEINKLNEEIQNRLKLSEELGSFTIHSPYEEEYDILMTFTYDRPSLEAIFYREFGEEPLFVDYDEHPDASRYTASKLILG